jgi:F-type H+-transporting ATPase subunit b
MDVLKEGLLKVDPGLLLWTIIIFGVLVLILWKAAWKPIINALDSRAKRIRDDIDNAELSRQEAQKLLEKHHDMVDKAHRDVSQIIAKGKSDAERLGNEIVEKARQEAEAISGKARKEIERAREKALAEIKTEVVSLSTEMASKIIRKNLNPEDQKALVEEALEKMKSVQEH